MWRGSHNDLILKLNDNLQGIFQTHICRFYVMNGSKINEDIDLKVARHTFDEKLTILD